MPGGDRSGPMGMGPMTGRGAGYCAGYGTPGYGNAVPGRGFGLGWGRGWMGGGGRGGRGWRRGFYATGQPGWLRSGYGPAWGSPMYAAPYPYAPYAPYPEVTKEQETEALRGQAEFLKQALDDISKRLGELEKES